MEDEMKKDFDENNMSPYQISVKYGVDIELVWKILEENTGDKSEEGSF